MPDAKHQAPYPAYGALVAAFAGGIASTTLAARRLRRHGPEPTALHFALLTLATFKASRTLAGDEVTSFIRAPFVRGSTSEPDAEEPVETGDARQAIGELLTCSRCVGVWAAASLVATDVLAPRLGRVLTWSLALAAANDWIGAGFSALTAKANALEQQA
jgi:hypothetical protein